MNLTSLDRFFSLIVRCRADWTCAYCGRQFEDRTEELHCSHFHSRMHKSVRFDFENCDALCWECHAYFDTHPRRHEEWKRGTLGRERFEALESRARKIVKLDTKQVRTLLKNIGSLAA